MSAPDLSDIRAYLDALSVPTLSGPDPVRVVAENGSHWRVTMDARVVAER
jgi:hypothetical protein